MNAQDERQALRNPKKKFQSIRETSQLPSVLYLNDLIAVTDKETGDLFESFFQSVFTISHYKRNPKESRAKIDKIRFTRAEIEKHWRTSALVKLKALMVWEISTKTFD